MPGRTGRSRAVRRSPVQTWSDRAALARFFARLAVKEHLRPDLHVRPLVAELFLTDNCNLRCISCACWRTTTRGELDGDEWRGVIDQVVALGIIKANFTGGEPLLRRDAPELMAYARGRGIANLHLNTNAVLLDDRRRDAVLSAGVRSFNVSIDGPDAGVHDDVRGVRGSFDRTSTALAALVEQRARHRLRIRVSFTVMRRNLESLPEMMRLAQQLTVPLYLNLATDTTFLFRHAQVTEQASLERERVDAVLAEVEQLLRRSTAYLPRPAELRYLRGHFQDVLQPDLPCAESQLKLMIHSRGEVGGCWGHDPSADVRKTALADVVGSAHYRQEHARFFRKECVGCGSNYALNLRWRPSSYLADARWRLGLSSLADPASA